MKYKIVKRANPQKRDEEMFYPSPILGEQVSEDQLTEEISFASSVNQSDVRAVLLNLLEILPRHLQRGNSVHLERFGIFRLSFQATGSQTEAAVSAKNITRPKILFRPSVKLRRKIAETSFIKEKDKEEEE
ncbi:MAG: HU family DNA-binding protein [Spirochaetia bacterium]|nr:HU family DNA-binding protein [Spirochaetia bacterium]